jgi:hypothetical protein
VHADFQHLLSSWFNPGFLRLVQVDWSSPAALLERIIQREAVHEIDGWSDLRRRLQPDRRCSAGPPRRSALSNSRSRPSPRSPTASPACAAWLSRLDAIRAPRLRAARRASLQAALDGLRARHGVELAALAQAGGAERAVGPFHLNNGARLQRVNVSADLSRKGLRQSFGLMVNYMYDLDEIEVNHEHFMQGEVAASRAVLALM